MAHGRPHTLTEEIVERAEQLAAKGITQSSLPFHLGVPERTFKRWLQKGRTETGTELETRLWHAIFSGAATLEEKYASTLDSKATAGDSSACMWLLTHHPVLRHSWSDAAAERRTEKRTVATVIDAIAAAGLPADMERRVLLQIHARGLSADQPPAEQDPGDDADQVS